MNATVKRIVELMFEDLQPSDEVATLLAEVLANCQERFQDCVDRGMSEDDAIAAVIESLKGMEDVLADYPRKQAAGDPFEKQADYTYQRNDSHCENTFTKQNVRKLRVSLTGDDVTLLPSSESCYRVAYDADAALTVRMDGDTLVIERNFNAKRDANADLNFNKTTEAHGRDAMFASIGEMLNHVFGSIKNEIGHTSSDVTVYVPQRTQDINISTTSGDIKLDGVSVSQLKCSTASGDLHIKLYDTNESTVLSTASGDVEATLDADRLEINTMSGDLTYRGTARQAKLNTVSGDIDVNGLLMSGSLKSVSGDIDLYTRSGRLNISSTSGDVTVNPAERECSVHVKASTVSGHVRPGHYADLGEQSDIVLHVSTVSGSVEIGD